MKAGGDSVVVEDSSVAACCDSDMVVSSVSDSDVVTSGHGVSESAAVAISDSACRYDRFRWSYLRRRR